jgi:chemotaxis protein MotB
MALSRRSRPSEINVWPGWVDALSSLVIVVIFVVLVFVVAQSFLQGTLVEKNSALEKLRAQVAELADLLSVEQSGNIDLKNQLARLTATLAASEAARTDAEGKLAALSKTADDQTAALTDKQNELALLNEQVAALHDQLARIIAALNVSDAKVQEDETKIADLNGRLNTALLAKVEEMARYRSEFFGRLREVLGNRQDVKIVGDRFVLSSELLFPSGSAELQESGKAKLQELAGVLVNLSQRIPADIPWILQVQGHTDKRPIDTPQFHSNWDLSTARAVAVVHFLVAQGLPADRLEASGFGEFQPIDTGSDEAALARNRRIELRFDQK